MSERASRKQKVFVVLGLPTIAFGLFLLVSSGWDAWEAWYRVARWPRANAVLVSKDISSVGARLEFRYTVYGETSTGVGFRWGSEASVQHDLESYIPGTVHEIAFNPQDPNEIEPNLRYNYSLFRSALGGLVGAAFFIIGGSVVVFRWSKPNDSEAPTAENLIQEP